MRRFGDLAKDTAKHSWWAVRQIFGDAAYENYLRSVRRSAANNGCAATPLSPAEFYIDSLSRRYSKISRCC